MKNFQRQIHDSPSPSLSSFSTSVTRTIKHLIRQSTYQTKFKFSFSVTFRVYLSSILCYFKHIFRLGVHTHSPHIHAHTLSISFSFIPSLLSPFPIFKSISLSHWYITKTFKLIFCYPLFISSKQFLTFKDLMVIYMPKHSHMMIWYPMLFPLPGINPPSLINIYLKIGYTTSTGYYKVVLKFEYLGLNPWSEQISYVIFNFILSALHTYESIFLFHLIK